MPSKAITQPPEMRPGRNWRNESDSGPSAMRGDNPQIARGIAFVAAVIILVGGMALALSSTGWANLFHLGIGGSSLLLTIGIAGLLFHAAFDGDMLIRRLYMSFGYLCLFLGGLLSVAPYNNKMGSLFGQGFLCLFLGLLFLLAFLRNEDDAWMRKLAENVLGGVGAVLALVGLVGGNLQGDFLMPMGLLVALLGIVFLTAFVASRGVGDETTYRSALAIGAVGLLILVIALLRSALPPLFYHWHWRQTLPAEYLVPQGLLMMAVGLVYVSVSLLQCSEWRWVVLTRRELGALFYSPIAYILLFVFVVFHWWAYFWVILNMLLSKASQPEPIVSAFILQWSAIISTVVVVPVLTMRLLSEEKRSGTLEVLLTVPVDEGIIVLSKFLAAWIMYLFMWAPFGLFLIYLRIAGGSEFDYRPLFSFAIGLAVTAAAFVSMGVFFSSLTRNQVASGVLCFAGMLPLTLLYFVEAALNRLSPSSAWVAVLNHISYVDVWIETLDGRLLPLHLIFFASMTVVWLFFSVKVLEARKWA